MKIHRLATILLLIPMAFAHAGENALSRVEHSCTKYPTPDARTECEKKKKEVMAAFDKEEKAGKKAAELAGNQEKKNGLCFTRKATGEVVCPN